MLHREMLFSVVVVLVTSPAAWAEQGLEALWTPAIRVRVDDNDDRAAVVLADVVALLDRRDRQVGRIRLVGRDRSRDGVRPRTELLLIHARRRHRERHRRRAERELG